MRRLIDGGWLFPGLDPLDALSTRQLNRAIHAAAEAAHIDKRVSMRGGRQPQAPGRAVGRLRRRSPRQRSGGPEGDRHRQQRMTLSIEQGKGRRDRYAMPHHPHVHGIIPGGGLSPDGERWIACRPGFFLPVRVLSRLFRRRFLEALESAHRWASRPINRHSLQYSDRLGVLRGFLHRGLFDACQQRAVAHSHSCG
ncbi:hypothetical protein CBM2589_A90352 [Cupriavidus taiwanensis]|uniref:Transposase IS801/IS1294 domain-containing protein n=1 Tax=Cupriavidus taiwanensis TaxID=164546 RepID=A0A375CFJ5_9BURK|nr:hypothetical protein CBM2589_A90352 [Cupriavidus taiwanensis]